MKKSVFRFLVTVATVAAVGFAVAGCSGNGSGGSEGLTITGIPKEFNGMWAVADGRYNMDKFYGVESINWANMAMTFPQIANGKVSLPLWSEDRKQRWTGKGTLPVTVMILREGSYDGGRRPETLKTLKLGDVEFENGKATVKYTDKE